MEVFYDLNKKKIIIFSENQINDIEIDDELIEIVEKNNKLVLDIEPPKNPFIKINSIFSKIYYYQIYTPLSENNKKNKNISGLNLIKISNNTYINKYYLSGKGMKVGIVDGGGVSKHYEFSNNNRVKFSDSILTNIHSTHVAGTICAYGYNISSKGVAPECDIYSYSFYDHIGALEKCAENEINVVNNSYGFTIGWDNYNYYYGLTFEEYIQNKQNSYNPLFGKYTYYSSEIDELSHKYKNFVMCFAAGNDRNDKYTGGTWKIISNNKWINMDPLIYPPPKNDGDFDCIDTLAISKNIISVGATIDISMETTTFSSWGPSDDLRIKPDVVANGDTVFSTSNSGYKKYTIMSGTSMACPFVSGCCILIQQFIKENLNYFPTSATVKASLIHGINNEIINGKNGYGLIDMENSLKYLEDVSIGNSILYNNLLLEEDITIEYSGDKLKITLCWIDPAGPPQSKIANDSKSVLINIIGLCVENNGTYYYPYRLNNKESDAVQINANKYEESFLVKNDNLQKIKIKNLSGKSTIYIKKIKLITEQTFSICISSW